MKRWVIPAVAIGIAIFLLTDKGRETQEKLSTNVGDWVDKLLRINETVQEKLQQTQSALEHFSHALRESAR
ncbi:MAG TPA: YtxH domain-containing protein [Terriglobales bacterium]|nr:YtxH domain-containing protein [Terriglobales bacterium]